MIDAINYQHYNNKNLKITHLKKIKIMKILQPHYKKIYLILGLVMMAYAQVTAISSNMTHRSMSGSPLLYRMIDYAQPQNCYEVEPIFMSMYDQEHTIANLTPGGKQTLQFNQQGLGDVNPAWFNLMSNNTLANYNSHVTLTPSLTQSGALFHWYDQFDNMFLELKTALVQCKSQILIEETGGGNGLNSGILNAQQAFTQSDWNYGKIGQAQHVVGLDDIELRIGGVYKATSNNSKRDILFSGFGIIQAPTGTGTKAEWLFEPQVGSNHWNLGLGFETLMSSGDNFKFMIAANYRYATPAWETRSFDLINCGPWSRYLGIQDTYGLPTAPATLTLPGINYLTQQAYINGRSQFNLYTRLQQHFRNNYFELSYNFLCVQQETIGAIKNMPEGFGIYAMTGAATGAGGVTTAPSATINENVTALDALGSPQALSVANFDKQSACATTYVSNNLTARLEIKNNHVIYGFGASIDAALSASALSTWSVWAQFGLLFGAGHDSNESDHAEKLNLYNNDNHIEDYAAYLPKADEDLLPKIDPTQDAMESMDDFEYLDDEPSQSVQDNNEIVALPDHPHVMAHEDGIALSEHGVHGPTLPVDDPSNTVLAHHGVTLPIIEKQKIDADQTIDLQKHNLSKEHNQSGLIIQPTQKNSQEDRSNEKKASEISASLDDLENLLEEKTDNKQEHSSLVEQTKQNVSIQKIKYDHEVTPMSDEEVALFLEHSRKNDQLNDPMTEDEILAKLAAN
jgi:hypothetical protein